MIINKICTKHKSSITHRVKQYEEKRDKVIHFYEDLEELEYSVVIKII